MFTSEGISFDTWVSVSGDCKMSGDVVGDQARFELGHRMGALHLVLDEEGLAKLTKMVGEALARLQAIPQGETVCFSVTG